MTAMPRPSPAAVLAPIVGREHVLSDEEARSFYSHDIAGPASVRCDSVIRPGSTAELARVVGAATAAGIAVFPRGGGMSYTGGYLPDRSPSIVVDLVRLDRVVRIDRANGIAIVEAGTTWRALYDALEANGMRVPSFGPLSGFAATVGGAASNDGGFFGTGNNGSIGGYVRGLTVVAADGALVQTGILCGDGARDWEGQTSLFIGDCGALGIKAAVALAIERKPGATAFLSFSFEQSGAGVAALAGLAGTHGIGEAFGFDRVAHQNLARTGFTVLEGAGVALDLMGASGGILARLKSVAQAAQAGKAFVADLAWSLHLALDAASGEEAAALAADVGELLVAKGGRPLPDIIPRVTRAKPFRPIKALLGPDGENWLPVHGILAHASAADAVRRCEAMLAVEKPAMDRHRIRVTVLTVLIGERVIIEPQFFWFDALTPFHRRAAQPDQVLRYGSRAANETARAEVHRLRRAMSDLFEALGADHFQLGRYYRPPPERLAPLRAAKAALDPRDLINPGVLGL